MNASWINRLLFAGGGLLLSAFCLLPAAHGSSWSRQRSGTMAWLHAVHFLDQNRGWVGGSNGALLQTVDGGASWKRLFVTKDNLRDIYFADERIGWLLAQRDPLKAKPNERTSYLLTTNDGGITWRRVFLNTPDVNNRFVRMVFTDPEHGWVFGETGVIFATSDGGARWMPQRSATKHLLLGGAFEPNGRGFVVGAGGTIMRSNDRGTTWQSITLRNVSPARFNAVTVVDNSAWAVGNNGEILMTGDGGRTWSFQQSHVDSALNDVKFINAREGWAIGAQGTLVHTTDGGRHWSVESIQVSHPLQRLFILDRNRAWAVGLGGTILKLGDKSPPRLNAPN